MEALDQHRSYIQFILPNGSLGLQHILNDAFSEKNIPYNYVGFIIKKTVIEKHNMASCFITKEVYSGFLGKIKEVSYLEPNDTCLLPKSKKLLKRDGYVCILDSISNNTYLPLSSTLHIFDNVTDLNNALTVAINENKIEISHSKQVKK